MGVDGGVVQDEGCGVPGFVFGGGCEGVVGGWEIGWGWVRVGRRCGSVEGHGGVGFPMSRCVGWCD